MQPLKSGAENASDDQFPTTRTYDDDSERALQFVLSAGTAELKPPQRAAEVLPPQVGRFQIRKKLGQGGYGSVYLAYDPTLEREIALKLPRQRNVWSPLQTQAFLKEARIAARLKHPHVTTIYDAGVCDEHGIFIAMEYVAGETLAQRLRRGKLSVAETVRLCEQVAEAIHQGHKLGLVHRDLKPANILLDDAGNAKVCDFGLALEENAHRSERGDVSGTWPYMSPEQIEGKTGQLDGRSDLWSLGVILYECLAGRRPFPGETFEQIRQEVLARDPKPLRQLDDAIPPALDELCRKCLQRDLSQRIRTAHDVSQTLAAIESPPARRWPMLLVVAGLMLLIGTAAGIIGFNGGFSNRPEVEDDAVTPMLAEETPAAAASEPVAQRGNSEAIEVQSLLRPVGRTTSAWQTMPDGNGVQAETQTVDLLSFGALTGDDVLEVDLQQARWTGGVGLFFGHRPIVVNEVESRHFHALVIEPDPNGGWQLIRFQYHYPAANPEYWIGEVLAAAPIDAVGQRPVRLRVRLVAGQIEEIAVDDVSEAALIDMSAKSSRPSSSGAGGFGLLLNHSGGTAGELRINGKRRPFVPGQLLQTETEKP